jgi:hypothetical protein
MKKVQRKHGGRQAVYGLRLNRNFMNYPLARDTRQQVVWGRGKDSKRWQANLPGENNIQLWFAADTPEAEVRLPSGFDMNVLFYLAYHVQITRRREVVIPSVSGLLHACGLYADDKQARQHVARALDLWQRLTLRYDHWHEPRSGADRRVLPPPITQLEDVGRRIKVTINSTWVQLAFSKSYYGWVPVTLPFASGAQNLYLRLLTEPCHTVPSAIDLPPRPGKTAERIIKWKQPLALARKIGVQRRYAVRLEAAFKALKGWLKARGGDVGWGLPGNGTLNIGLIPASMPRTNTGVTSTHQKQTRGQRAPKHGGNEHPKHQNTGVTSTIV